MYFLKLYFLTFVHSQSATSGLELLNENKINSYSHFTTSKFKRNLFLSFLQTDSIMERKNAFNKCILYWSGYNFGCYFFILDYILNCSQLKIVTLIFSVYKQLNSLRILWRSCLIILNSLYNQSSLIFTFKKEVIFSICSYFGPFLLIFI